MKSGLLTELTRLSRQIWREERTLNRRAFLQAGAGGLLLSLGEAHGLRPVSPSPRRPQVAVIGAGLAGLCATDALLRRGIRAHLYEAQDRVGGRVWSERLGAEGLIVERGGELIDSNHRTMRALCERFQLPLIDRNAPTHPEEGPRHHRWYASGAPIPEAQIVSGLRALSPRLRAERERAERSPSAFSALDQESLAAWLERQLPRREDASLRRLLQIAFEGEYGLPAEEQSALNLVYLLTPSPEEPLELYDGSDERWHIQGGNQRLPAALKVAIGAENISTGAALTRASGSAEGPYTLHFQSGLEVHAELIVFALPFSVLRTIDLSALTLSQEKRSAISALGYGTNTKLSGSFRERIWRTRYQSSGAVTADIKPYQGWDSSIGERGIGPLGVWTQFLGGHAATAELSRAPEEQFRESLAGLEQLWPGIQAAWRGDALRSAWSTFRWSRGSYSCFRPGQWSLAELIGRREGHVLFCGEHCSEEFQGWMEGAAETGVRAAEEGYTLLQTARTRSRSVENERGRTE